MLRLAEGEHAGQPFVLQPWQAFIVGSLFGWKAPDGWRRFRNAYVEIGKGNGKSPMAGGMGLYMLAADNEASAECYAAATTRDQAGILFRDAVSMVEASPELSERIAKSGKRQVFNLAHLASGSFFRPVSAEGRALDGKRVHFAALDEVHEHPNGIVVDKMRAGTKGRRQALIFEITNSGYDRNTVCYQHHDYSRRVLEGTVENDSWFAYVCQLDEGDEWAVEGPHWLKANPNLGVSITRKYLREQVAEAVGMPSKQSIVRRLNFCEWVEAAQPWIDRDRWMACLADLDFEALRGRPCFAGLDLSGKNDLTALALAWRADDGSVDLAVRYWTPADSLLQREDRDRVPYRQWRDEGWLEAVPGRSIDYAWIAQALAEIDAEQQLVQVAYDRWRVDLLLRDLDEAGIEAFIAKTPADTGRGIRLSPFGQGFQDMGPAVDALETSILNGTVRVQRSPVTTMCSANAVLDTDPAGNRKFTKAKSIGRIDGIVAAAMAVRLATSVDPPKPSVYATRGLRYI